MSTDEMHPNRSQVGGASRDPERLVTASPRQRPRTRRRTVVQVVLLVAVALVGYYLVSLAQVWTTGRSDQARSVDAIVVMGAAQYDGRPSPQLAARLDHVIELWPRGLATTVVVTGGKQPGDRFTEAEASADYLIERGVPASAIVLENNGRSTFESLHNVAAMLDAADAETSVLVVTDPYHSLRSRLIAQDVGLTAYVSPTDQSVIDGWRELRRNVMEAGGVAIGRLFGFGKL